jgi:hypothetical protein
MDGQFGRDGGRCAAYGGAAERAAERGEDRGLASGRVHVLPKPPQVDAAAPVGAGGSAIVRGVIGPSNEGFVKLGR